MSAFAETRAVVRDAATGVRHELAELRALGPRSRQNATIALSVGLGATLALVLHVEFRLVGGDQRLRVLAGHRTGIRP